MRNFDKYLCSSLFLLVSLNACTTDANNGRRNLDVAYLKKLGNNDSVVIQVFKETPYMVHDPVSALIPKYYIDSATFIIPDTVRKNIPFQNVQFIPAGGYPFIRGDIKFIRDSLRIELWYNDYDHKIIEADAWNKEYLVKWE